MIVMLMVAVFHELLKQDYAVCISGENDITQ